MSEYERAWMERKEESMMLQLEWLIAGYDGRHGGLWYFPILCHDGYDY